MAQCIWKYPLADDYGLSMLAAKRVSCTMPVGARVLSVQLQRDTVQLWAAVDTEEVRVVRHFVLIGTGHPEVNIDIARLTFIGTVQVLGGKCVYHVFEEKP